MGTTESTRREFLRAAGVGAATGIVAGSTQADATTPVLAIDPEPQYDLSPHLYMQFMEPLGTTDGSVAAAWDFAHDRWREDVVAVTRKLGPPLMRWGGIFCDYYRWREGVGPRDQRTPALNILWGGIESNQVGTHEFVDFCRQTGADPLICVNFLSDGHPRWMKTPKGEIRSADAREAAEWVRYCNDPDSRERRAHGVEEPYDVLLWQIGNETNYSEKGLFDCDTAARHTVDFARAMRAADPRIKLIGWGDRGWARRMTELAGEHIDYIAFHHMFNPDRDLPNSPLKGIDYRKDPAWTWERLMNAQKVHDAAIRAVREEVDDLPIPLAMTECHFALPGRNRCEVLSTWAAGVANARLLNVHERHGDKLKIATLADFCGTRWQVNAVMIPVPGGRSYMMPVARVMSLYRHHSGAGAVKVARAPGDLDVTASRTGDRFYLHAVNTHRQRDITTALDVAGRPIDSGRVFTLVADPEAEVIETEPDVVTLKEDALPADGRITFPAASVSAVEVDLRRDASG
jgi:alpha-N-arabinofuranosidase